MKSKNESNDNNEDDDDGDINDVKKESDDDGRMTLMIRMKATTMTIEMTLLFNVVLWHNLERRTI